MEIIDSTIGNTPAAATRGCLPLLFGAAGVVVVATCVVAPWTLVLLGAAIIFALSFAENEPFLLAIVVFLPVNMSMGNSSGVNDLGAALRMLVVAGFFLGRWSRGQLPLMELFRPAITRTSVLFLGAVAFSAVLGFSGETHAALRGVYYIATYIGFYLIAFVWIDSDERLRKVLLALMISALAIGAFVVYEFAIGEIRKPNSGFGSLVPYLTLLLAFCTMSYFLTEDRLWKWMSGSVLLLGVIAIALVQARGGYIGLAVVVFVAIWRLVKSPRKQIATVVAFAAVAIVMVYVIGTMGPARMKIEGDTSLMERLILWGTAWQMFQSSPIFGAGFGSFELINGQYLSSVPGMEQNLGVHNIYLELLAETGLVGFVTFLAFTYSVLRTTGSRTSNTGYWLHRAVAFMAFGGGIGVLVQEISDHSLFWAVQVGTLYWFVLGIFLASRRCIAGASALLDKKVAP